MDLNHLTWPGKGWGYMPPIKDVFEVFEYIEQRYHPRSILEIGYHAGHSTSYMLETFPNSHMVSYGVSTEAKRTMDDLMNHYRPRLDVLLEHSISLKLDATVYDFCLIDGSHNYDNALLDISLCVEKQIPLMLIDNSDQRTVIDAIEDGYHDTSYKKIKSWTYYSNWNNVSQFNGMELWASV